MAKKNFKNSNKLKHQDDEDFVVRDMEKSWNDAMIGVRNIHLSNNDMNSSERIDNLVEAREEIARILRDFKPL